MSAETPPHVRVSPADGALAPAPAVTDGVVTESKKLRLSERHRDRAPPRREFLAEQPAVVPGQLRPGVATLTRWCRLSLPRMISLVDIREASIPESPQLG